MSQRRPPRPTGQGGPRIRRQPDVFDLLARSRTRLEQALAEMLAADDEQRRARRLAEQQERERVEAETVAVLRRAFEAAEQSPDLVPSEAERPESDADTPPTAEVGTDFLRRLFGDSLADEDA